jgi:hypothetical protein
MASKQQRQARQRARQLAKRRRRQAAAASGPQPFGQPDPFIGYVACDGLYCLCDGDGCVVAGSRQKMQNTLRRAGPGAQHRYKIQAARFAQIMSAIEYFGAAYCFDEEAYGRFLAPARGRGMPLQDEDFSDPGPLGMHFVRVQQLRLGRLGLGAQEP